MPGGLSGRPGGGPGPGPGRGRQGPPGKPALDPVQEGRVRPAGGQQIFQKSFDLRMAGVAIPGFAGQAEGLGGHPGVQSLLRPLQLLGDGLPGFRKGLQGGDIVFPGRFSQGVLALERPAKRGHRARLPAFQEAPQGVQEDPFRIRAGSQGLLIAFLQAVQAFRQIPDFLFQGVPGRLAALHLPLEPVGLLLKALFLFMGREGQAAHLRDFRFRGPGLAFRFFPGLLLGFQPVGSLPQGFSLSPLAFPLRRAARRGNARRLRDIRLLGRGDGRFFAVQAQGQADRAAAEAGGKLRQGVFFALRQGGDLLQQPLPALAPGGE